jgi:N-formylglutamate deformylase
MPAPVYEFVPGAGALLISFPHSGTQLPEDLHSRLTPTGRQVPDTDWHVPQLYDFFRDIGASLLIAQYSRYVVDLNRPADGAPLYPGQAETSVCPTRSFADEPLYLAGRAPSADDIQQRLHDYWHPYHQKLAESIDAIRMQHGHCILWDAHSIRARVPLFFEGRLPDLNIGTADGRSCARARAARLMQELDKQKRFSAVHNGRFKGGYITRHYGDPARGVDAIQMEIAQDAYMDEDHPLRFDAARAADLRGLLHRLLAAVIKV